MVTNLSFSGNLHTCIYLHISIYKILNDLFVCTMYIYPYPDWVHMNSCYKYIWPFVFVIIFWMFKGKNWVFFNLQTSLRQITAKQQITNLKKIKCKFYDRNCLIDAGVYISNGVFKGIYILQGVYVFDNKYKSLICASTYFILVIWNIWYV